MEKPDFNYRRKPAFISFLLVYFFCFAIAYLLIDNSSAISKEITALVNARLDMQRFNLLINLPYGIIFSLPFLIYGIRKLLWNLMSVYEINSSEIRLLTGSLIRTEQFFHISDFYGISFKQNLIETPLGIGCLILDLRHKSRLIIRGVYNVKYVAEVLRSGIGVSY